MADPISFDAIVRALTPTLNPDAPILEAWARRVEAHAKASAIDASDEAAQPYWDIITECDKLIHSTVAKTPKGVEVQVWTALHNSSAYLRDEEAAIIAMDLDYVSAHAKDFDWDAMSMIAALRSLRAMEA
ncbi:hypothetical protein [Novosphingobium olei]|uniref:Uncharacterized protein n=1 Tax=Novosphingobium olei TaxID=2728851 RepID=A0A7Y0BQG8_9SPHN|nr:hypothetical protein [Novosphingobium olei]NML94725.1 hypothetical protein [Novosphingobium olei]